MVQGSHSNNGHILFNTSCVATDWQTLFLFLKFYWSMVDLHCTAKWFSYTYICIFFHICFHYGLSWDIEYSALCCIVVPYYLSILCLIVFIYSSQTSNSSFPLPSPPWQPQVLRTLGDLTFTHLFEDTVSNLLMQKLRPTACVILVKAHNCKVLVLLKGKIKVYI